MTKAGRDRRKQRRIEHRLAGPRPSLHSSVLMMVEVFKDSNPAYTNTADMLNAVVPSFSQWMEKKGAKLIADKMSGNVGAYLLSKGHPYFDESEKETKGEQS